MKLMSHVQIIRMYESISKLYGRGGYEYNRTGGSSGTLEVSKEFISFLKQKSTFPRASTAVKILKNSNDVKWDCYYIGVTSPTVKKISYCNIKQGGSFWMPETLMSGIPFFQEFLASKCKAALILYKINGSGIGPTSRKA